MACDLQLRGAPCRRDPGHLVRIDITGQLLGQCEEPRVLGHGAVPERRRPHASQRCLLQVRLVRRFRNCGSRRKYSSTHPRSTAVSTRPLIDSSCSYGLGRWQRYSAASR